MSQEQKTPVDEWMLKASDGREYGPVTFACLCSWAAQNRYTAGYAVSNDRRDWHAVETVPGLGLDWYVEPQDGVRYGPFHPLALMDYIREGSIPPETRVVHKTNGGEAKAYQVLLEAFVDAIDQTAEEQTELAEELAALREKMAARDRVFDDMKGRLQAETQKRQELELLAQRPPPEDRTSEIKALQLRVEELERNVAIVHKEIEKEKRAHAATRSELEAAIQAEREAASAAKAEAESKLLEQNRELEEKRAAEARWRIRANGVEQELRQARERLHAARREAGDAIAVASPVPPPRRPGVLAGLEARAQAELKAWQEKNQNGTPPADEPPKPKTWMPWKKS